MEEMLTVWRIRGFTHDLVEHVGGRALDRALKRHLGIGNSTGLGMAPFHVNHPVLLNNWMLARETALARVRAPHVLTEREAEALAALAHRSQRHLAESRVPDPAHQTRIDALETGWRAARRQMDLAQLLALGTMDRLLRWSETRSLDAQELPVVLRLEPFGDPVGGLADCMPDPFGVKVQPLADT